MKSSARNQLHGIITRISETRMVLQCGEHTVYALAPAHPHLRPHAGQRAVAMVKASALMLLSEVEPFQLLSENILRGTVCRLETGTVNHVVTLDLGGGQTLSALITLQSSETLDVRCGQELLAVFAAEQVVVAVLP